MLRQNHADDGVGAGGGHGAHDDGAAGVAVADVAAVVVVAPSVAPSLSLAPKEDDGDDNDDDDDDDTNSRYFLDFIVGFFELLFQPRDSNRYINEIIISIIIIMNSSISNMNIIITIIKIIPWLLISANSA